MNNKPKRNEVPTVYAPIELKVGDKLSLRSQLTTHGRVVISSKMKGSVSTVDELEDMLDNVGRVVTFDPGASLTTGQYTYSSPKGATIYVDNYDDITQIEGRIYKR